MTGSPEKDTPEAPDLRLDFRQSDAFLKAGAPHSAIFNSANFSSIATDAECVIQIFNHGVLMPLLGAPAQGADRGMQR